MRRTDMPFSRRLIKAVALIVISCGLFLHIVTHYQSPLIAGLLVLALAVVNTLCLVGLRPATRKPARVSERRPAGAPVHAR